MSKIRIYELAKELRLDNKKVIDEAKRLGVDVHQPSNSVSDDVANKIREKYFPKKVVAKGGPILVKKAVKPVEVAPEQQEEAPEDSETIESEPEIEAATEEKVVTEAKQKVIKLVKPPEAKGVREMPPTAASEPPKPIAVKAPEPQEEVDEQPATPAAKAPTGPRVIALKPIAPVRTERPQARPTQPVSRPQQPRPGEGERAPRPDRFAQSRPASSGQGGRSARPGTLFSSQPTASPMGADLGVPPQGRTTYVPPKDKRKHGGIHSTNKKRPGFAGRKGPNDKEVDIDFPDRPAMPSVAQRRVFTEFKPIRLTEGTTVKDFSEKLEIKPKDVVSALMRQGILATINQTINADVARDIGRDFGYEVEFVPYEDLIVENEFELATDDGGEKISRAPVVTVMGHVDHGKTSLLDAIRSTRVAEGEAGGITQHIGAYSVQIPDPDDKSKLRRIVFLDTPGHEAFTMMRARGAKVTDVVILVVAADDGVMPQTIEAIDHARAAGVPIIVAINKIDKPDANPDRVKQELANRGLQWEGWGGDTVMVEVSAKKRQNLELLLENVIITTDLLELKASPKRLATGAVLEAKLDKGRGAVATILVQNGTLKVGDPFIVGAIFGRVRAMFGDRGQPVIDAGPATPVEVLGFQSVPLAGDIFQSVDDVAKAQQISAYRQSIERIKRIGRSTAGSLEDIMEKMRTGDLRELRVIVKADVQGSVEVVKDTLNKLSTDKIKVSIIRSGAGAITESDVMLASASLDSTHAVLIIGFNVRPEQRARELAERENIDIRLHSIIYKMEEEIRNAMIGMLDKTKQEVILGRAEIRNPIRVPKVGTIAGSMVLDGIMKRNADARIIRDNAVIQETKIAGLRRFKDDVSEVKSGFECGILLERFQDVKVGDIIEAYTHEEVAPTSL